MSTASGSSRQEGAQPSSGHSHGHRRQESMYALTGLYSETTPENDDGQQEDNLPSASTYRAESVVKCHSRNPSATIVPSTAKQKDYPTAEKPITTVTKQCGILSCRPDCLQKCLSIKVSKPFTRLRFVLEHIKHN